LQNDLEIELRKNLLILGANLLKEKLSDELIIHSEQNEFLNETKSTVKKLKKLD